MAIYRLEVKSISRRDGRSAVAAAAYRSGERLQDDRTDEVHDYTRRRGVTDSEMILPDHAPQSFRQRSEFWNAVEAAERRKDAKVAREIIAALPHELDEAQRRDLARAMAKHVVDRYGVGVDLAIHAPDREADQRNWHCHLLFSTRQIEPDGFGAKTRQLDVKHTASVEVQQLRERWADFQNRSLERAGLDERVNHRSNAKQGIDRSPEPKLGPVATKMEREGRRSMAGDDLRRVRGENAALAAAIAQRKVIDLEIERERRAIARQVETGVENDRATTFQNAALQGYFEQERQLTEQATHLRNGLENQSVLQRFWFNLTGRNADQRNQLQQIEHDLHQISQQRAEEQRQHDAMVQSHQIAQEARQEAVQRQDEPSYDHPYQSAANNHTADFERAFSSGRKRDGPSYDR